MKIVCVADTHMEENKIDIPECDILIYAGDNDIRTLNHLEQLNRWFYNQSAKHKICVGGNHDFYLEKLNYHMVCDILNNCNYLFNNSIKVEGLKIWGSPYSPLFNDWAFMRPDHGLANIWAKIPEDTDIVVTHCPPYEILDKVEIGNRNVGSFSLLERIKKIKPKLHVFGHIHECYGIYKDTNTIYVNASQMTSTYQLENETIVIEI